MIGTTSQNTSSSDAELSLKKSARRVILAQVVAGLLVTLLMAVYLLLAAEPGTDNRNEFVSQAAGKLWSSLYGSLLAIASTILGARSVGRASKAVATAGEGAMVPIYSGLLNKLVIVGGGIAFGLIVLGLSPVYVVIGYLVTQLASASAIVRSGIVSNSGVENR